MDASARSHPDVPTWGIDSTFGDVRCSVEPLTRSFLQHLPMEGLYPREPKIFLTRREEVVVLLLLGGFECFFD